MLMLPARLALMFWSRTLLSRSKWALCTRLTIGKPFRMHLEFSKEDFAAYYPRSRSTPSSGTSKLPLVRYRKGSSRYFTMLAVTRPGTITSALIIPFDPIGENWPKIYSIGQVASLPIRAKAARFQEPQKTINCTIKIKSN